MSMLVDHEIRRLCIPTGGSSILIPATGPVIEPFSEAVDKDVVASYGLNHAGYDLRIGTKMYIYKNTFNRIIDPLSFKDEKYRNEILDLQDVEDPNPDYVYHNKMKAARAFILPPHSYGLAATVERLCIPHTFKAHFIGKSTYARCGIIVNLTPGEPGWRGRLTVEISNPTPCPVMIYANQGICQMELYHLSATPERLYDDKKYQDQVDITLPRSSE